MENQVLVPSNQEGMEALASHVHEIDTCTCATGDPCMNSCDEEHTAAAMATDAMNKFSELLSALGALHAKEGSRHSETMRVRTTHSRMMSP